VLLCIYALGWRQALPQFTYAYIYNIHTRIWRALRFLYLRSCTPFPNSTPLPSSLSPSCCLPPPQSLSLSLSPCTPPHLLPASPHSLSLSRVCGRGGGCASGGVPLGAGPCCPDVGRCLSGVYIVIILPLSPCLSPPLPPSVTCLPAFALRLSLSPSSTPPFQLPRVNPERVIAG